MARKRTVRLLLILIPVALLAAGLAVAVQVRHFQFHLRSARIGLSQLDSALTGDTDIVVRMLQDPGQFGTLHDTVLTLKNDLVAMESLAHPVLAVSKSMQWVPVIGHDLEAAPDLLEMADHTCDMALSLLAGLEPVAGHLSEGNRGLRELGPDVTKALNHAMPQVQDARAALEQANQARREIDAAAISPRLREMVSRFDSYAPSMALGLDAIQLLRVLLGAERPMTYLVLAQNSDELRATGGFISGVGRVQVVQGQISDVSFQDSYTVDNLQQPHPEPPEALRRYMKAGMLVLRDANWWPNFPTSARMVADLYRQDTGHAADGVIAVDVAMLELLLDATGPVEVAGYPEPVSGRNLHSMLMQYWQAPLLLAPGEDTDWWSHRKDFAADLLVALLSRAMDHYESGQFLALARAIGTGLAQRHVQVYVRDPGTEALLRRTRWDGAVQCPAGDFLMVVDSNVGFNKVNPNIEQTIGYDVVLDSLGRPTSQLILTYQHTVDRPTPACIHEPRYGESYQDLMERCYWDYLRIYLPTDSELIAVEGSDSPADRYDEAGCTVIGTAILVETGKSRTIRVTYRPVAAGQRDRYTLLVQKQAGTDAIPLRIRIGLPEGAQLRLVEPASIRVVGGQAVWQGTLIQDVQVSVEWQ